jgi:hypothetical protein
MTTTQNPLIGVVVKKSLLCFILTFVVNLIMNILKLSQFLGDYSDALTPFFEIVESTLLVEALRFEPEKMGSHAYCQNCGMVKHIYSFVFVIQQKSNSIFVCLFRLWIAHNIVTGKAIT